MSDDLEELLGHLKGVWCDTLELKEVTIDQSFFESGGDSMQAIWMLAAVLSKLETEIDFERFFENPTIRNLAQLLQEQLSNVSDRLAG
jgi:acyl carrier protein